mgnify:FL=1
MLIFYRPFTNPYLNIAAEEYFVKNATDDICMIWINEKSVIIGKHQNAYGEINYPYVSANHIPVVRRISGGGAVYHDTGNVNFSFIRKTSKTNAVDFNRFTSVVVQFIQSLGLEVNISKRNSLFIGDRKFSGHAEHIFHDRVLHHGTILWKTDLAALENSLVPSKSYSSKAMESVRSEVCNLAPLLTDYSGIQQFTKNLVNWLLAFYSGSTLYKLQENDLEAINTLSGTKYKTWQWNFGYSPAYSFSVQIPLRQGSEPVIVKVENGTIVGIEPGNEMQQQAVAAKLQSMLGLLHREEDIDRFVKNNHKALELDGLNTVNFTEAFFR